MVFLLFYTDVYCTELMLQVRLRPFSAGKTKAIFKKKEKEKVIYIEKAKITLYLE